MSHVVINTAALNRLLKGPTGPVAKVINQKAESIFQHARSNIQSKIDSRTGDLEASLRKIPVNDPDGYRVVVGADATHRGFPYALALETGINPLTGAEMNFTDFAPGYMVPAVRQAGFRQRSL